LRAFTDKGFSVLRGKAGGFTGKLALHWIFFYLSHMIQLFEICS